jgi:hypothetical protein
LIINNLRFIVNEEDFRATLHVVKEELEVFEGDHREDDQ